MGTEYSYNCPKCDFHVFIALGTGFLFPSVYQETVDKAKSGEYGQKIKEFLTAFPDGKIDAESALYVCQECGNIEVFPDLSMYLPKEESNDKEKKAPWSVAFPIMGHSYVTHFDLENKFVLFELYKHKCSRCQGESAFLAREKIPKGRLKCPKCKVSLKLTDVGMWD